MPYADPEARREADRRRYRRNRAKRLEQAKAWAEAHPERRREIALKHSRTPAAKRRQKKRYEDNREACIASATKRNRDNPEARRQAVARHQSRPEVRAARADRQREREARKRGLFVEHVDRLVLLEAHAGRCGICGDEVASGDFHVDHIVLAGCGALVR